MTSTIAKLPAVKWESWTPCDSLGNSALGREITLRNGASYSQI